MTDIYKLARPMFGGVTVEIINGQLQNVKNKMAKDILSGLPQFKGRLVVGNPCLNDSNERTHDFLEDEGVFEPFVLWVHDIRTTHPYSLKDRLQMCEWMVATCGPCVQYVEHKLITTPGELQDYIRVVVRDNFFPGIVLREPYGTYGTKDEEIPKESLKVQ